MSVVGIDLGTCTATIGASNSKGTIEVIQNETSSRQTPCLVGFGQKERFVGEAAQTQYIRNLPNTLSEIKRYIGRTLEDPDFKVEADSLPFKLVSMPKDSADPLGVQVTYQNEKRTFSITSVVAMLLGKLKQIATSATGIPCVDCVISIPAFWVDRQRRLLIDACKIAGLNPLRLIHDTTAVAVSHGFFKLDITDPIKTMFIDIGYSNTTASIAEMTKNGVKMLATVCDSTIGGRNIDYALTDYLVDEWSKKYKLDIKSNKKAIIRIRQATEKLKKQLNLNAECPISIECLMEDTDVKAVVSRDTLGQLLAEGVERIKKVIQSCLDQTGLKVSDLEACELIGGSSRSYLFKNAVAQVLGREPDSHLNQDEAVAKGATLQCAILSPAKKVREYTITDVTPYTIKLNWKTLQADSYQADDSREIFDQYNSFPSVKMVTFHQKEPFEMIAEYTNVPKGWNPMIGHYTIPQIPVISNPDSPLKIKVRLDSHGLFVLDSASLWEEFEVLEEVPIEKKAKAEGEKKDDKGGEEKKDDTAKPEAPEKKPVKKTKKTNVPFSALTGSYQPKPLQVLIEEEGQMGAADKLAVETANAKNSLESYIYDLRSKVGGELAEFEQQDVINSFLITLEDTENWIYDEGEDCSKGVFLEKLGSLKKIGEPIKKRRFESEHRPEELKATKQSCTDYKALSMTNDPKYDHISEDDRKKVLDKANELEQEIRELAVKQEALKKYQDPVLTVELLRSKKTQLINFCNPIMNKPKPAPKKEEKKQEEKKQEEKKQEEKKQEEKKQEEKKDDQNDEKKQEEKKQDEGKKEDQMDVE